MACHVTNPVFSPLVWVLHLFNFFSFDFPRHAKFLLLKYLTQSTLSWLFCGNYRSCIRIEKRWKVISRNKQNSFLTHLFLWQFFIVFHTSLFLCINWDGEKIPIPKFLSWLSCVEVICSPNFLCPHISSEGIQLDGVYPSKGIATMMNELDCGRRVGGGWTTLIACLHQPQSNQLKREIQTIISFEKWWVGGGNKFWFSFLEFP